MCETGILEEEDKNKIVIDKREYICIKK